MARVPKSADEAKDVKERTARLLKGRQVLGAVGLKKCTKKAKWCRSISKDKAEICIRKVDEILTAGEVDFETIEIEFFVGLFCWMHDAIYGVSCVEEVAREWNVVIRNVENLLETEFESNREELFDFMRWASKDEERAELWRRSNRRQGKRVKWRDWFLLKAKLVDYRVGKLREQGIE